MSEVNYEIVNIVASVKFEVEEPIDLKNMAKKNKDTTYNPHTFPGLIYRLQIPKSTVLIFSNGRLVLTGLRKTKDVYSLTKKVLKVIRKYGTKIISEPEVKVQNIVASGDLHQNLNLDLMSMSLTITLYEPEVFPGLIYRLQNPKVVFLIFANGKIVCVGAKLETDLKSAVAQLLEEIKGLGFNSKY
ncbi:MAG: TATA-box-binding protein [Candidatus Helarchaeota archaeon]|nr:TATA-box-binding protein [Candidatus Helarchaeota archaeon]